MLSNNSSTSPIIVNFTSSRRTSGSNSNFVSAPIDFKINKFDSVCLLQAEIPRSIYNIDSPYNSFVLEENGVEVTITIPPASYTNINILPVLIDLLNLNSPNGWVYDMYYNNSTWKCGDPDTFKFKWIVSGNGGVQPKFNFSLFSLGVQLGFEPNSSNSFQMDMLTSSNVINMGLITRCFIKSNVVINAYLSILEEIFNFSDYGAGQIIYYQQQSIDLNSRDFNDAGLNSWNFTLVDINDQIVNLNNIPWSISLVFYQRNNIHELQNLEMKIQNELRILDIQNKQESIIKQVDEKGKLIEAQSQPIALNPSEVPSLDPIDQAIGMNEAIFPVLPWGSSSIVKDVTLDSVNFPIASQINEIV